MTLAFWPVSAFAFSMAMATILHWHEFSHRHPIFWVWAAVYAITPILVPAVWWRNRATDPGRKPGRVMAPGSVRAAFALLGAMQLAFVIVVFLRPALAIDVWPWELTPLTARMVAGWFSLPSVLAIVMAYDGRRSAMRVPIETFLLTLSLIMVGAWRAWGHFDPTPGRWVFVAAGLVSLAGLGMLFVVMEQRSVNSRTA